MSVGLVVCLVRVGWLTAASDPFAIRRESHGSNASLVAFQSHVRFVMYTGWSRVCCLISVAWSL